MNVAHLEEDLEDFFKKYPNAVLDGELYNHDLKKDFEKIISLVRKQKPTEEDRYKASLMIQFHCYDIITKSNPDYETRYNMLRTALPICKSLTLIKNTSVDSYAEAKMLHDIHLAQGYEGSILRLNKPYEQKRYLQLTKVQRL